MPIDLEKHALVTADWLEEHLEAVRVIDARWRGDDSSRTLFLAGHIPGAVPLDWHLDLNHTENGVRDKLLPPGPFAAVMAAAGIGADTPVVAYAEEDHSGAARVWWALRYYGHAQVAVLDGGLGRWVAEGRPLEAGPARPAPTPARPFEAQPQRALVATADEIQAALDRHDPAVAFVDTRPREQYMGEAVWTPPGSRYLPAGQATVDVGARRPLRGGRLPGAIHLHSSANLDPATWTYLPAEALRARARAAGLRPEQRVITYCGVGISASLGLFALHLAGFENVALYDASWEEWGAEEARPIEKG
jgi:thiosulfate/3-mercaptopyruvate sulfurtransferase